MADIITTEYDDGSVDDFIQCGFCNKSIRGDTQYRIHLTTSQHLKKVETMSPVEIPVWESFVDYLDYLKLDEPIIGLSYLEQMEAQTLGNGEIRLKYKCKLCNLEADLPAMASHVVGRKHRQKFLELQRPDLVTWNKYSINQQGKMVRAKAEVVERQEGRGKPAELPRRQRNSRSNGPQRAKAPPNPRLPNQRQHMGISPQGFPEDPHYQGKHVDDGYYPARTYGSDDGYPEDASVQRNYEDDHFRASFPEGGDYGQRYPKDTRHEESYSEDGIRRRPLTDEPPRHDGDRYEPSFYEDPRAGQEPVDDHSDIPYPEEVHHQRPYGDDHHSDIPYPDRDHPHRHYEDPHTRAYQEEKTASQHPADSLGGRLYSERDPSGHSYTQVDRHQPAHTEVYEQAYHEEGAYDRRVKEHLKKDPYSRSYAEVDSPDWHPKVDTDRRFQGRADSEQYSERGFQPHHSGEDDRRERIFTGSDTKERNRGDEARYDSGMPQSGIERDWVGVRGPPPRANETKRRPYPDFPQHQGATHQEAIPTKKRKSRFSNCTEAERELLQKYQIAQAVSERIVRNPPLKVQRPESVTSREDYREHYRERGEVEQDPGNVMDVLKDVQIESVEEANFLKNKLCSLLKEFQANKSDRRGDQAPPMDSVDYGQPRREIQERPPTNEYSRHVREMPAVGHAHEDFRQVSPERYDRRSHERERPRSRGEPSRPAEIFDYSRDDFHRGGYQSSPQDSSFRLSEGSRRSYYDNPPEEDPRDFRPHSVRTRYEEDRRNPPSSLDKIASTLLQLVAHK
ncbi:uncharacterized protein si:ch211-13c6.2 isoform X2 [Clupea harengus]|uniref:Uncharacterized protein si:ch211-13c6.2 isoform X2 n=1 Tax=Clupea harengus TaxID=7950 RepID=A0A6P8H1P4_CLUHA|nr:uncharacterized protein si:ch211-13c6.2 isoform X2 [Clupea harengus]